MQDGRPTSATFADSITRGDIKPKAVLFCWPSSFLSTVPRLCLLEKGYPDDEYETQHVDISEFSGVASTSLVTSLALPRTDVPASGHNFSPSYLR
jgi:hypothetical protein